MKNKQDLSNKPEGKNGNRRFITISVSERDANRLLEAFAQGKLKDMGVIDVIASPEMETEATQNKWSDKERRKKAKKINEELQ